MQSLFLLLSMILGLVSVGDAREIQTFVNEQDGKTIISCAVIGNDVDVRKAQIFLYL